MKEMASAFVKAQKEFGPALKTSTNPHFKSRYADLSTCIEAVIDALNNNGIALIQKTHQDQNGVTVETLFLHESGESMTCGLLHVPASKSDPQGYGSALTYARRYSLMSACGIAPEDDDGNAASAAPKRQNSPPLITEDQSIELYGLAELAGVNLKDVYSWIEEKTGYKVKSFEDLKQSDFAPVKKALHAKGQK